MPEATYIPLDGSSSRSCGWWSALTGLEKVLIFLSLILAIFVFALTIALVSCKGETPVEPSTSTTSTSTTMTTTQKPTNPTTTPPVTTLPPPSSHAPTTANSSITAQPNVKTTS